MINYFSHLIRRNWLTNEFKAALTIIIICYCNNIYKRHNRRKYAQRHKNIRHQHMLRKKKIKEIILKNLRLNHKIRKRVTTVYTEGQQLR
jgi:hypothetical protein